MGNSSIMCEIAVTTFLRFLIDGTTFPYSGRNGCSRYGILQSLAIFQIVTKRSFYIT